MFCLLAGSGADQPVERRGDQCVQAIGTDHGEHEQESAQQVWRGLWHRQQQRRYVRTGKQYWQLKLAFTLGLVTVANGDNTVEWLRTDSGLCGVGGVASGPVGRQRAGTEVAGCRGHHCVCIMSVLS